MTEDFDIKEMSKKIRILRQEATELKEMSGGIQVVDRNIDRILASVRMLEIGISDVEKVI
jgi:hypothetical protein